MLQSKRKLATGPLGLLWPHLLFEHRHKVVLLEVAVARFVTCLQTANIKSSYPVGSP